MKTMQEYRLLELWKSRQIKDGYNAKEVNKVKDLAEAKKFNAKQAKKREEAKQKAAEEAEAKAAEKVAEEAAEEAAEETEEVK